MAVIERNHRGPDELDPFAVTMIEECEAFLAGRYAELLDSWGAVVPAWAWMNLVAHGDEVALRCAMEERTMAGWRQARAYLAAVILDAVDDGTIVLADLQREVLVPLELDVAVCRTAVHWTPGQLVRGLLRLLPEREVRWL